MPTYCYKCNSCEMSFERRHSMNYVLESCIFCESKEIFKIPSISISTNSQKITNKTTRPGKVVDEYIKQTKKDIEEQKKDLRRELD